jgi:hypothetical protein
MVMFLHEAIREAEFPRLPSSPTVSEQLMRTRRKCLQQCRHVGTCLSSCHLKKQRFINSLRGNLDERALSSDDALKTPPPKISPFLQEGLQGKDSISGQLWEIVQTPPDQQPAAPARLQRWGQRQPAPVVPAGPLAPSPALRQVQVSPALLSSKANSRIGKCRHSGHWRPPSYDLS